MSTNRPKKVSDLGAPPYTQTEGVLGVMLLGWPGFAFNMFMLMQGYLGGPMHGNIYIICIMVFLITGWVIIPDLIMVTVVLIFGRAARRARTKAWAEFGYYREDLGIPKGYETAGLIPIPRTMVRHPASRGPGRYLSAR